jgi:hypothetical protein
MGQPIAAQESSPGLRSRCHSSGESPRTPFGPASGFPDFTGQCFVLRTLPNGSSISYLFSFEVDSLSKGVLVGARERHPANPLHSGVLDAIRESSAGRRRPFSTYQETGQRLAGKPDHPPGSRQALRWCSAVGRSFARWSILDGREAPRGAVLRQFSGSLDAVSAQEMIQAIEEECVRVDASEW